MRAASILVYIVLLIAGFSASPVKADSHEQIGRAFLEALKASDFKRLQELTPPLKVWRKLSPAGSKKITDEELMKALEKNYYPKLRKDFDAIMEGARKRNVDISKLEFVEARLHKEKEEELITSMHVFYKYADAKDSLSLTVMKIDGDYYLSEILLSYDVFSDVAPK